MNESPSQKESPKRDAVPSPYVPLPALPTQEAVEGIRFDYCDGLRVKFPDCGGPWRLRVEEEETGLVSYDAVCKAGAFMATRKKWFCKHKFTIWKLTPDGRPVPPVWKGGNSVPQGRRGKNGDEAPTAPHNDSDGGLSRQNADFSEADTCDPWGEPLFKHSFHAASKDVLIQMAVGTLGDSIAWLPAVLAFRKKHQCRVYVTTNRAVRELFASANADVTFLSKEEAETLCRFSVQGDRLVFNGEGPGGASGNGGSGNGGSDAVGDSCAGTRGAENIGGGAFVPSFEVRPSGGRKYPEGTAIVPNFYAAYRLGLFFKDEENDLEPSDFRLCGLHHAAAHILDVPESETPPALPKAETAKIAGPYVVIATKASMQCKFWNHPAGWTRVIEYLKKRNYRVLCIDRERDGGGPVPNPMPRGCEDFTGNRPLSERAELIRHAAFFIGLPSGLSWLAWACRVPVVLIGGFSEPFTEFKTPHRVLSRHACHGCWNDRRCVFDHRDFMWCPRHKGTDRQFECSRLITPEQVIEVAEKLIAARELQ